MKVAEGHSCDAQQQRTLRALAAQDHGAASVAMDGDWKQRAIAGRCGVTGHKQDCVNAFIRSHPAQRGLDCDMKSRTSANFKTQDHRSFGAEVSAESVREGEAL